VHVGFDDLLTLAQDGEIEEDKPEGDRRIMGVIMAFAETLFEFLSEKDDLWKGLRLISCRCSDSAR